MTPFDRRELLRAIAATAVPGLTPLVQDAAAAQQAASRPGTSVTAPAGAAPELRRGPYLQVVGPDRVSVRFRTRGTTADCVVRYGRSLEALDQCVAAHRVEPGFPDTDDWEAVITGLEPSQQYYYAVEVSKAVLAGCDEAHTFRTAPPIGSHTRSRFWILGDCGTNRVDTGNPGKAVSARNGFRHYNQGRGPLDGVILLGDNAYSHGTDSQYQTGFFLVYGEEIRHTPLWPCIGNHELTDDYFGIFSVPTRGELGGIPSRCTNYYSFDHANAHFVVLDLWKAEWRDPSDPQRRWLEADLAATKQDWLIVINHFPPYCDGKYESDHNGFLVEVREKILPVLEAHGVDLLLTGHDHSYQRSYLLDGHHGTRETFDPNQHIKSPSDGRTTPIVKGRGPHSGIITVVTGAAGAEQPADPMNHQTLQLSHPAMVRLPGGDQAGHGVRRPGTFLLEIEGLTLVGTQIDHHAQVVDRFVVTKTT